MSFRRVVANNFHAALRAATRPPVVRQLPRRNYMVGLQPGIEEQVLSKEAGTAVELIGGYFGMMAAACAVGGIAGAYLAEHDNEVARMELSTEYATE